MLDELLRVVGIHKHFSGVYALRGVTLRVRAGEVHALVGENGSGKSTLMKIAIGQYQPDEGELYWRGQPVRFRGPDESIGVGIAAIAQEVVLVPQLTVAENVLLGRLPVRGGLVDWLRVRRLTSNILDQLGVHLDPRARVGNLPLRQQQMVSVARAIATEAKLLIFDESTSALGDNEVDALFSVIGRLREQGVGVVFISHRLKEIYRIADLVTVMRDGRIVETMPVADADEGRLTRLMVGRDLGDFFSKRPVKPGPAVLEARGLRHSISSPPIDLVVRQGEIVGLAGLTGAGRSELLAMLFGMQRHVAGAIRIGGAPARIRSPRDAIRRGLALVPEDRKRLGLAIDRSVCQNLAMTRNARLFPKMIASAPKERSEAKSCVDSLGIRTPTVDTPVRLLSGGNQQKVVIGKWLTTRPKVWLLDEPTRGIDVGSKAEIFRLMGEFAASGVAILMSSSELVDLLGICDRILVMYGGAIVADLPRQATEEQVMFYATGQRADVA